MTFLSQQENTHTVCIVNNENSTTLYMYGYWQTSIDKCYIAIHSKTILQILEKKII